MPDSKVTYPDAVQKVIDKMMINLKSKLSPAEFAALEALADDGRILNIEAILTVAEVNNGIGDEQ